MRGIIFLLALTLVGNEKSSQPNFSERQTYVYNYEGVVLTGLPENGLNRAGVKITAKVQISALAQTNYLMMIKDPQIQELNGIAPTVPLTTTSKLSQRMAADLTRPVRFEYVNGRVGKIDAPETLPENILNIHRGILNLLQITIKKTQNVYELQEAGIEGICHTRYILQEVKKTNHIVVTKSKDLSNCQDRAMQQIGVAYAQPCISCQQRGKNLRGTVAITQVLKPTKSSGALITEANSRELHQFTPLHELDGTVILEGRQDLTLNEIKAEAVPVPQVKFLPRGSLKYVTDRDILQRPIQLLKYDNLEAQIVNILRYLAQYNQQEVRIDAPDKFLQLIQLLRLASFETLKENVLTWFPRCRRWLLEALPAVGTADSLRLLKRKIQSSEIKTIEAAQALILAMQQLKADRQSLLSIEQIKQSPILRKIVLLGYGSVVNRFCAERQSCPEEVLQPLHDLLADAGSRLHEREIVLGLKAVGNAGQSTSIKRIQKFLPGFGSAASSLPLKVQIDAVSALRNIARRDPRKAQEITMQIFMNRRNHPEVRMMACAVLFSTQPGLPLVAAVANSLLQETSLQVASFTYSHMKAISRSSLPALNSVAAACNVAVKLLSPKLDQLGVRYSKVFRADIFRCKYSAAKVLLINSAGSAIPTSILAKVRGHALGSSVDLAEVGLRADGLQEALLRNRVTLTGRPNIEKIQRILKMLSGWKSLPDEVPLASAHFKLFGQEIAFIEFRKDDIQQRSIEQLQRGIKAHPSKALLAAEVRRIVPTGLGLPMELSLISSAVAVAKINGNISFYSHFIYRSDPSFINITPSVVILTRAVMGINTPFIQAGVELQTRVRINQPVNVAAKINIKERNLKIESKPSVEEHKIISLSSQVFAVSRNIEELSAAKMMPILPITSEASITRQEFKSQHTSTQEARRSIPRWSPETISQELSSSEEQRPRIPSPSTYHTCVRTTKFGLEVCLDARMKSSAFIRNCLLYRLIGQHAVNVTIKPVHWESEIEKIVLEIQTGSKAASKVIRLTDKEEVQSGRIREGEFMTTTQRRTRLSWSSSSSSSSRRLTHASGHRTITPVSSDSPDEINDSLRTPERRLRTSSSSSSSRRLQSSRTQDDNRMQMRSSSSSSSSSRRTSSKTWSDQVTILTGRSHWQAIKLIMPTKYNNNLHLYSAPHGELIRSAGSPILTILLRSVRIDRKQQGYQITGYAEVSDRKPRVHLRVVELAEDSRWKICADGIMPHGHKVLLRWGKNCQDYKVYVKASTGDFASHPAIKMKLQWSRIPDWLKSSGRMIGESLPGIAYALGWSQRYQSNPSRQITLLVALTSPRTIDTIVKVPKRTVFYQGAQIPLAVTVSAFPLQVRARGFKSITEIPDILLTVNQQECFVEPGRIRTFDNQTLSYQIPNDCHYVLTQDCSQSPSFILLMKRAKDQSRKSITLVLSNPNMVIEAQPEGQDVKLLINGVERSMSSLPIIEQGVVRIQKNSTGITLEATQMNLDLVYFDGNKVRVNQMNKRTCGICGHNDGERKMLMPNQEETESVDRFFQSWLCTGESCKDDCKVRQEYVELEELINYEGVDSRCYSVEPVPRCFSGCSPTERVSVPVSFHCVSSSKCTYPIFRKKSADLRRFVDSHSDCA
uniref:Phosvitin n=1 Tax=Callorhinchus milii TaxID=7868 RepID=A0A4W3IAF2_CALMI